MICGLKSVAEKLIIWAANRLRSNVEVAEYTTGSVGAVPLTILIVMPARASGICTEIVPLNTTRGFVPTPAVCNPIWPNNCGALISRMGIAIEFDVDAF